MAPHYYNQVKSNQLRTGLVCRVLAKMKHELKHNLWEQMQDFSTAIKLKDPLLNLI